MKYPTIAHSDRLCFELEGTWPIRMHQYGQDRFSVTYGKQLRTGLTYSQACAELGACIMHRLSCDGTVKNGGEG